MRIPSWLCSACLPLLLLPAPLLADPVEELDQGRLVVSVGDHTLGTEDFSIRSSGDSLRVYSAAFYMLPGSGGADSLAKRATFVLSAFDFDLRHYQSNQKFRGETLVRGVEPRDTVYTVFRELNEHGFGVSYARPPGRLFVLDGQIFASFVLICRHLQGRTFETRPLWLLTLSSRDTLLQVEARSLGTEALRWGTRTVQARKFAIGDARATYLLWASPDGRMLKLVQPEAGLLVLREPPPLRRPRKKT